jgi:hypothetical protein
MIGRDVVYLCFPLYFILPFSFLHFMGRHITHFKQPLSFSEMLLLFVRVGIFIQYASPSKKVFEITPTPHLP